MNVQEVMTPNPVCCLPEDTAQQVATIMCANNVGSVPIIADRDSQRLIGIVTDRDLCCTIIVECLDPSTTAVGPIMRESPVTCRPEDDLESCERAMQKHQIRRIPVIDDEGRCVGIVAQADLVLALDPQQAYLTVAEISRTRLTAV